MRATVIYGQGDIRLDTVAEPSLSTGYDAVVRVVAACVCGSDLWPYRGATPVDAPRRIGHEFVGIVAEVGEQVRKVNVGDFVIASFYDCDASCANCRNGVSSACSNITWWGTTDRDGAFADGAQGEYVRVPHADGTLVSTPFLPREDQIPDLLALADVMGTGYHAAISAGVRQGSRVVVVGDGAVGLCAVLAARKLGAAQVVVMSRNSARQQLARKFGATDVVSLRGAAGVEAVKAAFGGIGADCSLECVGTKESMEQAIGAVRPGGRIGMVGVPNGGPELPIRHLFANNIAVAGGEAPVRGYIEELLKDVLAGELLPGEIFDKRLPLDEVAEAYRLMDRRSAIKVLLDVSPL